VPDGAGAARPEGVGAALPAIKGFLETSFVDWRGCIAAVLFLPGCNFACPYCHNHALAVEPESYQTRPLEDVLARLRPFVGWIDGVVVSGGEPTVNQGLERLLALIKAEGFAVKLDTNGHRPAVLRRLVEAGLVDMVAMDLKAPLEALAYRRAAGVAADVARIGQSVDFLIHGGVAHEFRSTIIPGWHGPAELAAMAQALRGCQGWTLQAMNPATAWNQAALPLAGGVYAADDLARLQASLADAVGRR